jgi:hypothetical protein
MEFVTLESSNAHRQQKNRDGGYVLRSPGVQFMKNRNAESLGNPGLQSGE